MIPSNSDARFSGSARLKSGLNAGNCITGHVAKLAIQM
jgi:hypothetical protein